MKNLKYSFLVGVVLSGVVAGCSKFWESNVSDKEITFQMGIEQNTPFVSTLEIANIAYNKSGAVLFTDCEWELIEGNDHTWCGLYEGTAYLTRLASGKGSCKFSISVDQNIDIADREAIFKFQLTKDGKNYLRTFTIVQKQEPYEITITPNRLTILFDADEHSVDVKANVPCNIAVIFESGDPQWVDVATAQGAMGQFDLVFNVGENTTTVTRSAQIVLSNTQYEVSDTLKLTQYFPIIPMTINSNFMSESDSSNPATLSNVVSWDHSAWPTFDAQVISISKIGATEAMEELSYLPGDAVSSFDLTQWLNSAANREKYGNACVGIIVEVQLIEAGDLRAMGRIQANPYFGLGAGTAADPFLIYNYGQLNNIRNWSATALHYKQMQHIDLSKIDATTYTTGDFIGTTNFVPIGASKNAANNTPFTGVYDGNGHAITGLNMICNNTVNSNGTGIFSCMLGTNSTSRAQVKNLTVRGSIEINIENCVGGIVGRPQDFCDILHCVSYVNITSANSAVGGVNIGIGGIAGICGVMNNNIAMPASGNANATEFFRDILVENCVNYGDITIGSALLSIGGVIGHSYGTVKKCTNFGNVVGGSNRTGGIVGCFCGDEISECWNAGNISITTTTGNVGGIVGMTILTTAKSTGVLRDCYNTGDVRATTVGTTGGVLGQPSSAGTPGGPYTYSNCYSIGSITSTTGNEPGAFCGTITSVAPVVSCYACNTSTTAATKPFVVTMPATNNVDALSGLKTGTELATQSTFVNWDFVNIWTMGANGPYLRNNNPTP